MPEPTPQTPPAPAPQTPPNPATPPAPSTPPATPPNPQTPPAGQPTPKPAQTNEPPSLLGPQPASQVPEKYEFKLPDGIKPNETAIEAFSPVFKDLKLDQAGAQKLVDAQIKYEQSLVDAHVAAVKAQNEGWINELKKGWGAEFDKHVGYANKAIEGLKVAGLREALQQLGVGNHPKLVEAFAKIGAEFFKEAQPSTGRTDNGEPKTETKSLGQLMYPAMKDNPSGRYPRAAA